MQTGRKPRFGDPEEGGHGVMQAVHMSTADHDYRVTLVVSDLGWVDLDFECSTVCPNVPGQVEIWLKWLGN